MPGKKTSKPSQMQKSSKKTNDKQGKKTQTQKGGGRCSAGDPSNKGKFGALMAA
jgi:hypothetical protein